MNGNTGKNMKIDLKFETTKQKAQERNQMAIICYREFIKQQ